jgi:hypothetical protein
MLMDHHGFEFQELPGSDASVRPNLCCSKSYVTFRGPNFEGCGDWSQTITSQCFNMKMHITASKLSFAPPRIHVFLRVLRTEFKKQIKSGRNLTIISRTHGRTYLTVLINLGEFYKGLITLWMECANFGAYRFKGLSIVKGGIHVRSRLRLHPEVYTTIAPANNLMARNLRLTFHRGVESSTKVLINTVVGQ